MAKAAGVADGGWWPLPPPQVWTHVLLTGSPFSCNYRASTPPCTGPLNLSLFLLFLANLSILSVESLVVCFYHTHTHPTSFACAYCPYLSPFSPQTPSSCSLPPYLFPPKSTTRKPPSYTYTHAVALSSRGVVLNSLTEACSVWRFFCPRTRVCVCAFVLMWIVLGGVAGLPCFCACLRC